VSTVTVEPGASSANRRNTNLDALRAIAVLMVLGRHAGMAIEIAHASNVFTAYCERIGWAGVDLFFVLSGFLISGLLFGGYQDHGKLDISRFYIRRGLKIWPAFYALIAAGLLVDVLRPGKHFSGHALLSELFFVQDYFRSIWGITWSLAVEEHFYLLLPLVLLVMLRRDPKRPFASIPYVFGAVGVICLTCRFLAGWKQDGTIDPLTCLFPTHLRMDGLLFGVMLGYYYRFRRDVFQRIASWKGGWVVAAAAMVLLSTLPVESRHMHTWGLTVLYLGGGVLVAKAVAFEGPAAIRFASKLLAGFGFYSYSIYLWQMFFTWRVEPLIWRVFPLFREPLWTFWFSIAGPILFGIAAAKVIEVPVLRFRDHMFAAPAVQLIAPMSAQETEAPALPRPVAAG
jgi:peptidoglycan/LPS O-acetylase OafA/YrhL